MSGSYVIGVMCFVAVFGTLVLAWGSSWNKLGFSLLHTPLGFGLGAYISGVLAVHGTTSPWLGSIIGAVCVAILSVLIGAPLLRLRGYYLACATFGLLLVVEISLAQFGSITGGHEGLMGIPPLKMFGFTFETDLHYYYLSWRSLYCLLMVFIQHNEFSSGKGCQGV